MKKISTNCSNECNIMELIQRLLGTQVQIQSPIGIGSQGYNGYGGYGYNGYGYNGYNGLNGYPAYGGSGCNPCDTNGGYFNGYGK